MRKRIIAFALSLLILCLTPIQMFAQSTSQATESEVGPMWTHITEFTNSFDISSSGLAQFDTSLYARSNVNKVVIEASIQQYSNGSWQTIKSWTSTSNTNSGYLAQKWYVVSGYYYRLVSTGAVYQNDVLMEQTSFTGSSYWY
ncbi:MULTISPECIES: hypothetical protein [Desulfitobacterium]|uniref:Uncharacterized protein n=1 Tax=Desulfitobacterium dehalogenans (strain ATCC 51507 / DSM 9161 / JW/IU-DC1) TaxID=756499 RepID=I4ABA0_DESDJ|nr:MULTISPECIES: hypothetical protein [Desulfitobacterium]AFM01235.1 hypothetical protein Desde_2933 [Desulfitobacterium dehalogenans ATCC 51507]